MTRNAWWRRPARDQVRDPAPRRFGRDRRGATATEFALLAGPFLTIVFATLETSFLFVGEMTLDHAVAKLGRQIRTGEAQSGGASQTGMTAEEFRDAICEDVDLLLDCDELKIDLRSHPSFVISTTPPIQDGEFDDSGFGYALPGRQTITSLHVYYRWPLTLDVMRKAFSQMNDGSYLMSSTAAFRTEPF